MLPAFSTTTVSCTVAPANETVAARVNRFAKVKTQQIAWATLLINVVVIMQGAVVRVTGSGAGCGRDWPRCQGELLPLTHGLATWIEYSHRALSGVALLLGVWLLFRAMRLRHIMPGFMRMAALSIVFLLVEALIGAGTVLAGLTGDNVSTARGLLVAFHLLNSLALMGVLALATLYSRPGQPWPPAWQGKTGLKLLMGLGLLGMLVLMFSGGIAAMGNTMFPPQSLQAGLAEDFSAQSHPLIRLRLLHPFIAIAVGGWLWLTLGWTSLTRPVAQARRFRKLLVWVYGLQLIVGATNLALLGPVLLQLLHLGLALLAFMLWTLVTWTTLNSPLPAKAGSPGQWLPLR